MSAATILAVVEQRGTNGTEQATCARFADLKASDLLAAVYATVNRASRVNDDVADGSEADHYAALEDEFTIVETMAMILATRLEPEAWRRAMAIADDELTFNDPQPVI
jgi:hypothetical protein